MAETLYVTDQELQDGLDTKVDKSSIDAEIITTAKDRIPSSYIVNKRLTEVEIPADLKECIEQFDNMYLGYKATHPTQDINGASLSTGLMYWNTTDKILYIYQEGSGWIPSISTTPTVMPMPVTIKKFDVLVTTTTDKVVVGTYNPDNVVVYLNGFLMAKDDYEATDGTSITFEEDLKDGDVVSGFSSNDDVINKFDILATDGQTEVSVPSGYDPTSLNVFINGILMSVQDYTATDGSIIIFEEPLSDGDVVSGFSLKNIDELVPIVTEYPTIEDAPNPAKNGALAFDLKRGELYYYSTEYNGWIGWKGKGEIGFYDKYDDFEDPTVAKEDKLYIDRQEKNAWLFDGSQYIPFGVWSGELLPPLSKGVKGNLYIEGKSGILYRFDGTEYKVVSDPNRDEVQVEDSKSNFIYTGKQDLFLAKDENRLYSYNGRDFIPISNAGVGEVKFVESEDDFQETEELLQVVKENGKVYYYDDDKKKRANKEVYRVPTKTDLQNATKDEDFIYIVDDDNTLWKWDNGTEEFEPIGTSIVSHTFAKESDISHTNPTPTRDEVEKYASDNGLNNTIIWGNLTNDSSISATWGYSVDVDGKAVIVYSKEEVHIAGFAVIDGEQDFDGVLNVRVENNLVEITDGSGKTINVKDVTSNGALSNGTGSLMAFYNGQKFPNVDVNQDGNYANIDATRVTNDNILFDNDFIEIIK